MRILELSAVVTLIAYVAYELSPYRNDYLWLAYLPLLCIPIVALHLWLEGPRWEMVPIYFVFVASVYQEIAPQWTMDVQAQYVVAVIGLCCIGVGILLSTIFPVFQLPPPTGPYAVGTSIRHLVDESRADPVKPGAPRELMVQIWYPAERGSKGRVALYQERATTTLWDARFSLAKTHSVIDATLRASETRYPVLLYAPSWNGMRTENTHLAEQMASQGFVVVGIDHPYSSFATVFPDGRVITSKLLDEDFYVTEASFDRFLKTAETEIRTRADDARFVLNALEKLDAVDEGGPFAHRLDLDHVGIFGFSLGGGVAAQACWLDRRFKACLNMDGLMAGESFKRGAIAPLFFMSEVDPSPPGYFAGISPAKSREKALDWEQFVQARKLFSTFGGYWLTIKRAKHFNFSDYAFSSPLHFFSRSGVINPTTAARTVDQYAFAFFEYYLKGDSHPLLEEPTSDLTEIRFEKSNVDPPARP
jgi:dienelactone hydrolase